MDENNLFEEYFEKPYWVIDVLPKQVPANGAGQYFKIESYLRGQPYADILCNKFTNLIIKLNCYYDIEVFHTSGNRVTNPAPEVLRAHISEQQQIFIVLNSANSMIGYYCEDHYMTLYNPSEELLELVRLLAVSEGLFVWRHND